MYTELGNQCCGPCALNGLRFEPALAAATVRGVAPHVWCLASPRRADRHRIASFPGPDNHLDDGTIHAAMHCQLRGMKLRPGQWKDDHARARVETTMTGGSWRGQLITVGLLAGALVGTKVAPVEATCVDVSKRVQQTPQGYEHFVVLRSHCEEVVLCRVGTNVVAKPVDVRVLPGETKEVLSFRRPAAEHFITRVRCLAHPMGEGETEG